MADRAVVFLRDRKRRGGATAQGGFDFQRAYALLLLAQNLRDPAFSAVMVEGAEDVELRFDRFIDEICSTIDWLLGQPLREGPWDAGHCEDLYVDRQTHWEQHNQKAWPYW